MNFVESGVSDVSAIHDIKRTRFGNDPIEEIDVVYESVSNANKHRDIPPQVQECVHLYGAFSFAKSCPRKQRKAQIDRGRIESVSGLLQVDADLLCGVHGPRQMNQHLREIGIDAPIASFVGVGHSRARHRSSDAHMIQFRLQRPQTGFDIAETFAVSQLCKSHAEELIEAGEFLNLVIPAVASDAFAKLVERKKIHDLREHRLLDTHRPFLSDQRIWNGQSVNVIPYRLQSYLRVTQYN